MKARKSYIDILKIIAIFFVLYTHTGNDAMHVFENTSGINYGFSLALALISAFGPTLFFIVSGSLLLSHEESLKEVFKKRILRYFILLVVIEVVRIIYFHAVSGVLSDLTFKTFFTTLYSTNVIEQYWFLHAYLAFLLMLPFMRLIAKGLSKETALYLLILFAVFDIVFVLFELAFGLERISLSVPILTDIIILPLAGYIVEYTLSDFFDIFKNRLIVYVSALICFLIEFIYGLKICKTGAYLPNINGIHYLIAFAVFIAIRALFKGRSLSSKAISFLKFTGGSTLVIFLFEPELRDLTHFIYALLAPVLTWFPATILWLFAAILLGAVLAFVLRKIPGVKKYI